MEEKEYQENGELHRKPYNFFKQEVKRKIRIGEKEYVRSELMNANGNTASISKIIKKQHNLPVCENHERTFQACYRSTENCQFQPCSPIKKFGFGKYDHMMILNFNDGKMMYKWLNSNWNGLFKQVQNAKIHLMILRGIKETL